jgi:hypothetical protein
MSADGWKYHCWLGLRFTNLFRTTRTIWDKLTNYRSRLKPTSCFFDRACLITFDIERKKSEEDENKLEAFNTGIVGCSKEPLPFV